MATNPSNTNPGLTIKPLVAPETALPGAAGAPPSTDGREALQTLLAFSTLHDQIRRKRAEEARRYEAGQIPVDDVWEFEQFVMDEVLQLVAERAQAISGADGIAIALAEGDEIVCRASTGAMAPDRGVRLDAKAGFSGLCFRTGRIIRCDDSEKDPRVNVEACRRLGTRSMVAVPLHGQQSVVGLLEAFSTEPFGFNDGDVRSLNLLAELILAALKPEDEDRIVRAAKVAAAELHSAELESLRQIPMGPPQAPEPRVAPDPENVPLELARETIAPALHIEENEGFRLGIAVALVVLILGGLLASGVWWGLHAWTRSHAVVAPVAAPAPTTQATPTATTLDTQSKDSPTPGSISSLPSDATAKATGSVRAASSTLVTGIRHSSSGGSSTVIVDLEDQVQYEAHRLSDPERIYFDLLDTSLAPGLNGKTLDVKDGLIGRVRIAQPSDDVTRVVLDTKPGSRFAVSLEQNPYRLVIEVRGAEDTLQPKARVEPPAVPVAPAATAATLTATPSRTEAQAHPGTQKLRIVLDPGHGGWDLGTVGREGLLEKNLVLDVSQRLGALLEKRLGSEVIFTRNDDNYLPLEQRAELANHDQADLFVSVHANYSSLASARGVETYYSSFFSPPEAREIEYRENGNASVVTRAKLTGLQLKGKVEESRKLANSVQQALHGTLAAQNSGVRNRGVREASFVVLTGTEMPSILAEISFVSSPADEEKLRNGDYRQQIAEALFKGIERFAAASHHAKIASASARGQGQ